MLFRSEDVLTLRGDSSDKLKKSDSCISCGFVPEYKTESNGFEVLFFLDRHLKHENNTERDIYACPFHRNR